MIYNQNIKTLIEFLEFPLNSERQIIDKFISIPGSVYHTSNKPREEFVFIRGIRPDRVTLIAHCDTVFDNISEHQIKIEEGRIISANEYCGIGADDRAGCAMLWLLRNSGHNILIVNGEEATHIDSERKDSYFLIEDHPEIAKEIQESSFMLQFDRRKCNAYTCYNLPVSSDFVNYIENELNLVAEYRGWTDIIALSSKTIAENCCCAANLSIAYYNAHKNDEYLVIEEWNEAFEKYKKFLKKQQKRFINN